jgi:hypothetical protein
MRLVTILILMAVVVLGLCQPAIPGKVTVFQAGKSHEGSSNDQGKIVVTNPSGRTIMYGEVSRIGSVELTSMLTDDTYVGKVNPMGYGLLISPKTADTIRIELER